MKFKNIKKNPPAGGKKPKSPSNSRTITEQFIKIYRLSLKVFIVFIFLMAVFIVGLDLDVNIRAKQEIDLEREKLANDLMFWKNFIKEHENYKDAYFQASILEYKLGNISKAKTYVEKGLFLDPNSEEGQKIEEFLDK